MPIAECGLKKKAKKIRNPQSEIRNNWADGFFAQRPCFRATSLLFHRKENRKSEGEEKILLSPPNSVK